MRKLFNRFNLRIGLANDVAIRSWSFGEVTKAETINYKTEKPVPGGLFCEKIFGPVKDNECACGKYRRIKYKGKVCNSCDVLVTESIVRRRRLGHIELQDPIVHIWFYRSTPSPIATALAMEPSNLERLIQYKAFAVVENGGDKDINLGDIIDFQYNNLPQGSKSAIRTKALLRLLIEKTRDQFEAGSPEYAEAETFLFELESGENATFFLEEFICFINESSKFELETGGLAVETLLKKINITKEIAILKAKMQKNKSNTDASSRTQKRLKLLNNFHRTGQKLEWMTTRTIPVLPPELRPIVHLEGGRFATSGINKLYNELLIRKNRLVKHQEKFSPGFMVNQLRALVQEAADVLFDKSLAYRDRYNSDPNDANTRSIAENLKGKTGRFRSNLLGKRIDYSAGSVIVGGPDLQLNECGLPRDIAIVIFRAMIIGKLLKKEIAPNKRAAEKMIDEQNPIIWDILENLIRGYPILLNRAPTLHRLGIQGFFPRLVRGKAIQLHPLVTTAFNADFDGDRMSIHLPLTENAKTEAKELLMSNLNILNPRNGQLIVMPSQDMILGIYYLTSEKMDEKEAGSYFISTEMAEVAYHKGQIKLHTPVFIPTTSINKPNLTAPGYFQTTVGKIIFNRLFPDQFLFISGANWQKPMKIFPLDANLKKELTKIAPQAAISKSVLIKIINRFFAEHGREETTKVLDQLKNLGFKYSTRSGTSISFFDLNAYKTDKETLFEQTHGKLQELHDLFDLGGITKVGMRQQKIKEWTDVKENIEKNLEKQFIQSDLRHSIYAMVDSGARGSLSNLTQLVGMRGLMVNTRGETIETPIKSSLVDGLNYLEFFISTYGARKGMVDTALKTADSGYLTRRLVDVAHDFYITSADCGTKKFFNVKAIIYKKTNSEMIGLATRVYSRMTAKPVLDENGQEILGKNILIGHVEVEKIQNANVKEVAIRSVLTCGEERGVCQKCFGLDLANNQLIKRGQAIGVLAAQSIGEPATQLTMRTFHTGGVSDVADITQGLPRVIELFDVIQPKKNMVLLCKVTGKVTKIVEGDDRKFEIHIAPSRGETITYKTAPKSIVAVKIGDQVQPGTFLTEGSPDLKEFLQVTQDPNQIAEYIIEEVQKVYYLQGIDLADKYIEIIIKKIMSICKITDPSDTNYTTGEEISHYRLAQLNRILLENKKKPIQYAPLIMGTKQTATKTFSFLSAASFQETTQVLIKALLENRTDELYGLKENVIVGNIIPVGTGSIFSENWISDEEGELINPYHNKHQPNKISK